MQRKIAVWQKTTTTDKPYLSVKIEEIDDDGKTVNTEYIKAWQNGFKKEEKHPDFTGKSDEAAATSSSNSSSDDSDLPF